MIVLGEFGAERLASVCHEANRAYCLALGDSSSQPRWEDAPEWQRASAVHGVEAILLGVVLSPEQSHENWLREKAEAGWQYGPVKDPEAKTHPCMVAYGDLPEAQRRKDALFFGIVKALAY